MTRILGLVRRWGESKTQPGIVLRNVGICHWERLGHVLNEALMYRVNGHLRGMPQ